MLPEIRNTEKCICIHFMWCLSRLWASRPSCLKAMSPLACNHGWGPRQGVDIQGPRVRQHYHALQNQEPIQATKQEVHRPKMSSRAWNDQHVNNNQKQTSDARFCPATSRRRRVQSITWLQSGQQESLAHAPRSQYCCEHLSRFRRHASFGVSSCPACGVCLGYFVGVSRRSQQKW